MNKKEVAEIKKQLKNTNEIITKVSVGHVSLSENALTAFEEFKPVSVMDEEVCAKIMVLLRKVLTGKEGDSLFTLRSEKESPASGEIKLAYTSAEQEGDRALMEKISKTYHCDRNYCIITAHGTYDVPAGKNEGGEESYYTDSENVYHFLLTAISPLKADKPGLVYHSGDMEIGNKLEELNLGAPLDGFLYPCFHARTGDYSSALIYAKKDIQEEFCRELFHMDIPSTTEEKTQAFRTIVETAFPEGCPVENVRNIIASLDTAKDDGRQFSVPEMAHIVYMNGCEAASEAELTRSAETITGKIEAADLSPDKNNLITPYGGLKLTKALLDTLVTKKIDGKEYFLIPTAGCTLNGIRLQGH